MDKAKPINSELDTLLKSKKMWLFDFDGTIANTEPLQLKAYNECLKDLNVFLTDDDFARYVGKQELQIYKLIKSDFNIIFDDNRFLSERTDAYLRLVKTENLTPYPYFMELLKNKDVQFNILTSNRLNVINSILDTWDMRNSFNQVISAATNGIDKSDVINDIDGYFGFKSDEIAIFEDANTYLRVAQQNNILAIGIQNTYNYNRLIDCDYTLNQTISGLTKEH